MNAASIAVRVISSKSSMFSPKLVCAFSYSFPILVSKKGGSSEFRVTLHPASLRYENGCSE